MRSRVKQGLSIYTHRFNISARLRNGRCRAFTLKLHLLSPTVREGVGRERYTGIFAVDSLRCEIPRRAIVYSGLSPQNPLYFIANAADAAPVQTDNDN